MKHELEKSIAWLMISSDIDIDSDEGYKIINERIVKYHNQLSNKNNSLLFESSYNITYSYIKWFKDIINKRSWIIRNYPFSYITYCRKFMMSSGIESGNFNRELDILFESGIMGSLDRSKLVCSSKNDPCVWSDSPEPSSGYPNSISE